MYIELPIANNADIAHLEFIDDSEEKVDMETQCRRAQHLAIYLYENIPSEVLDTLIETLVRLESETDAEDYEHDDLKHECNYPWT